MTFAQFLIKYYSSPEREEIHAILSELRIYGGIETALNEFYHTLQKGNKIEIISQFAVTIRKFILIIYKPLHNIHSPNKENTLSDRKSRRLWFILPGLVIKFQGLNFWNMLSSSGNNKKNLLKTLLGFFIPRKALGLVIVGLLEVYLQRLQVK